MKILFQIITGFVLGYLMASVAESFLHRNVLHARKKTRELWHKYPRFFAPFIKAHFSHHVIHHAKTFKKDFVTQFENDQERKQLDAQLRKMIGGRYIIKEKYGLTLKGWGVFSFVAPILPIVPILYYLFGQWIFLASLIPITIYPLMSKVIHPFLHTPFKKALTHSPKFLRWILNTKYIKFIAKQHYMHHKYINCNYNLLLGGDILFGVYRKPSSEDIAQMKEIGLPVD